MALHIESAQWLLVFFLNSEVDNESFFFKWQNYNLGLYGLTEALIFFLSRSYVHIDREIC